MKLNYQSIWTGKTGTAMAVAINARSAEKKAASDLSAVADVARFALNALAAVAALLFSTGVYALPVGGVVAAGAATIATSATRTTVTQSTQSVAINWERFGIEAGQAVQFIQPGSSAIALNRVLGPDPSNVFGNLSSNGKLFLVNPNGILFGLGASVNVGGLVASTRNITDSNFVAGKYIFDSPGSGGVVNRGTINADGGYVALLGASVSNQGVIAARMGTVALAAGSAMTLDIAGDKLLNVTVDQGAVNALVENGGLIQSDGGLVLMTAQAAGSLLSTVVNNTGLVRAQTISNINGTIKLLADMRSGTVNVGGALDASAPNGGNGGFIETSAARVNVRSNAQITTAAAQGLTGKWLIDPQDFIVGGAAADNISGATLSALLVTNSVTISTSANSDVIAAGTPPVSKRYTSTPGNGDIFVNQPVTWTPSSNPTTLSLNAERDVNLNAAVTATSGNFSVCCGRDINVNAAITTTSGSVLLSAGRNVNQKAALTVVDGNAEMSAAKDVNVSAQISLTNGSRIVSQSLGLPLGLTLNSDGGGTGPGSGGGTVKFTPSTLVAVVTNAPVTVYYDPILYSTPTDYSTKFTLTEAAALRQYMLVFPGGADRGFDGTSVAHFTSLKGAPVGVTLIADPGSTATFDTAIPGLAKSIVFSNYSLGGPDASKYAFATACCGSIAQQTTANVTPIPSDPSLASSHASQFTSVTPSPSSPRPLILTLSSVLPPPQPASLSSSIPQPESSWMLASLDPPQPVELAEVPSLEKRKALSDSAVQARYIAPVRRRKQDRH